MVGYYLTNYMKVFKENYVSFTEQAALSSMVLGIISTFLTGAVIDYFGSKSEMTVPLMIVFRCVMSIPTITMVFYQQKSFGLAMAGIHIDNLFVIGWGSSASYMLRNIVDPKIAYLGVSMFMLLANFNSLLSTMTMAYFVEKYNLDT
jgi:hypothetical protein